MASAPHAKKLGIYIRLWHHECMRVFSDRLCTDADRTTFLAILEGEIPAFGMQPDEVFTEGN